MDHLIGLYIGISRVETKAFGNRRGYREVFQGDVRVLLEFSCDVDLVILLVELGVVKLVLISCFCRGVFNLLFLTNRGVLLRGLVGRYFLSIIILDSCSY